MLPFHGWMKGHVLSRIFGFLFMVLIPFANAIYPKDLDQYSVYLDSMAALENHIVQEITAGRTLIAPAWNRLVRLFAGVSEVSFGDVDLSSINHAADERHLRQSQYSYHSGLNFFNDLGDDGWPSIRYFNGKTGVDGEAYIAKTSDMKLCDELGTKKFYLMDFVAEVSGAKLCSVIDLRNCDYQALRFLHEMKEEGKDDIGSLQMSFEYLLTLGTKSPWVWNRLNMVKQLLDLKQEELDEEF